MPSVPRERTSRLGDRPAPVSRVRGPLGPHCAGSRRQQPRSHVSDRTVPPGARVTASGRVVDVLEAGDMNLSPWSSPGVLPRSPQPQPRLPQGQRDRVGGAVPAGWWRGVHPLTSPGPQLGVGGGWGVRQWEGAGEGHGWGKLGQLPPVRGQRGRCLWPRGPRASFLCSCPRLWRPGAGSRP